MQIQTLYDLQLYMFVFVIPIIALIMCIVFGLFALVLEVFKQAKPQTAKVVIVVAGCVIIAWLVYTWKSGQGTEANRALIRRLERDYKDLQEEVIDLQIRRLQ